MSGNFAIKGGRGGGRTPNGKCHLKFPFWLFDSFPNMYTLFPSYDHEECCFWWRNGGYNNSFHMTMAPYVALHFPQQQKDLAKMGSFANKVDFAMEKKHSNESTGKKFFCEPILAVRITLETFQCHRWEHNLFSLRLKVWQIDILILNWLLNI